RDLYTSALWKARRTFADAADSRWYILSARYGLVDPDETLESYDEALTPSPDCGAEGVEHSSRSTTRIGARIARRTRLRGSCREGIPRALEPLLRERGATLMNPVEGLGIGKQLAWYADRARPVARRR